MPYLQRTYGSIARSRKIGVKVTGGRSGDEVAHRL